MNWKERILNTISGKNIDHMPFVPRLDIWYKSNKLKGTLPLKYSKATLAEIVQDMGLGLHTVVPDFTRFRNSKSIALVGLGIYDLDTNPYSVKTDNLDFKSSTDKNGLTETLFKTPFGNISTKTLFDSRMASAGATIGHTLEHAYKNDGDADAIGYIFENLIVKEESSGFISYKDSIGDNGACIAFCMLSASPVHLIMKELASFENFIYQLNDNPQTIEKLASNIEGFFNKVVNAAAFSVAEIIFCGANYDSFLTWPAFFHRYITPYLKKYSGIAHNNNKFFLTHTDGENTGLINEYLQSNIDVADSICPFPMTKLKLEDIRNDFGEKITIWGGLPSICVLEESMNEYSFDNFLDKLFENIAGDKKRHLILSFADTTPPQAKFERVLKVAKLAESFRF